MKCLEKDPTNRPESAHALRCALDAVELERPWSEEDARAWWASHQPEEGAAKSTEPTAAVVHGLSMTVDIGSRQADLDSASGQAKLRGEVGK